jgi:hypothetical protein
MGPVRRHTGCRSISLRRSQELTCPQFLKKQGLKIPGRQTKGVFAPDERLQKRASGCPPSGSDRALSKHSARSSIGDWRAIEDESGHWTVALTAD